MRIGILGTGVVGQTIRTTLVSFGHDVKMGARPAGNEKAEKWVKGMPPTLSVCNTDSLGEQIQREFPGARVLKTLNTTNINFHIARP